MIIKLGLRNLTRSKTRTILSCMAIAIGLCAIIFVDGFVVGIKDSMIKTSTETYLGHAQIHSKGYLDSPESENTIKDKDRIVDLLKNDSNVSAYSERVISEGMITSPTNMLNVQIVGITPEQESKVSKLSKTIGEGDNLQSEIDILIGKKLAEKLDTRVGEKIVLTAPIPGTDELSQELYRVKGLFSLENNLQDLGYVFVSRQRITESLGLKNGIHEIAIRYKTLEHTEKPIENKWSDLVGSGNEYKKWQALMPSILSILEMSSYSIGVVGFLLLVTVLITILNNLFMSIFDRIYEFGVMQAVGTRKKTVFVMIVVEAIWLSIASSVIGIAISAVVGFLVNIKGINFSGVELGQSTISEPIYYVPELSQFIIYPAILIVFGILSAIYPAYYATKITLNESMKKSL